ncbi:MULTISPECIES: TonB-dependent receptor [Novosphingobium]|uniref:TonB-dependent receptor n=1 Tax=Novosphingobium TaxID=165696 RepID=UPI0003B77945|nr:MULTISPECIES: TonB-dependent receptor [Novosphingobium]KPF53852.1 TonB-dependent receptor [Novosphingobium sp. AAP1]MBB3358673.1 iron complex outermembrane receptor protein [Novosphingobium sp. BK256]MBB3375034.1 iron complex outermembrane receptor protein [Novosphingobium sp. BK280]MBB3379278.1 iron complex outermembrane receptor protein [Novosphingobium sp. BK258]MBB3420972.1 iron complex outermembrane receptor protein [Novosphingobium sp. BK267]
MRRVSALLAGCAVLFSCPAFAADAAAPAPESAPDAAANGPEIVVLGTGQTRQTQEIKAADLAILASGTSPLKAIEKLPSVNFQSADAFGNYEWSTRVTIRGFNQNQLGFTLDGIPLGNMSYGNNNGLHVSRAISPENIGVTAVSQGSGAIDTQSTSNLGGTLEFKSIDPAELLRDHHVAIDASGSYGSSETWRGFGRLAVGTPDGVRAFGSLQYQNGNKWKGDGQQRTLMTNFKFIAPAGRINLEGWYSYSDRVEQDYQDLSLALIARHGYNWDNFGPHQYATAVLAADVGANTGYTGVKPTNPAAGTTYPDNMINADDAYYDAAGLRRDWVYAFGASGPLNDTISFNIKSYYHHNRGQGLWGTPYLASPSGVPMSVRTTEYDIKREGVFGDFVVDLNKNKLTVGGWAENNDFNQARRFYGLTSRTVPGIDFHHFLTDPFATQWYMAYNTTTVQYYVMDDIDLGALKINLGWKGFDVINRASKLAAQSNLAVGRLEARDWFQPHAGLTYKLGGGAEVFAGFTQVTRAFTADATSSPFSTTQAGFNQIAANGLKPEQSDTYEGGLRVNNGPLNAVLGGYLVNFRNRLLTIPTSVGIVGAANLVQNVGNVRAYGLEAVVNYKLPYGFALFASYSYNNNTYRDNVVTANGTALTAGKTVVDTPKHLARGEISYDSNSFFGRVAVNYMSKRYFTYLNDQSVPGRALVDATLGYRIDVGQRTPLEIQVNGTNLFDKSYIATIGSNGFGFSGDNQTLLAGAPRQVFVTLKAGF